MNKSLVTGNNSLNHPAGRALVFYVVYAAKTLLNSYFAFSESVPASVLAQFWDHCETVFLSFPPQSQIHILKQCGRIRLTWGHLGSDYIMKAQSLTENTQDCLSLSYLGVHSAIYDPKV